MLSIKIQIALSVLTAILLGLLLVGIGYLIAPYTVGSETQIPIPAPSTLLQIFTALIWVGAAALVAFCIVALGVIINRQRQKKTLEIPEELTG